MTIGRSKLLERGENAKRESKYLDFKRELDISTAGNWCEIIKDIVAFANSGGGIIVFGVNNDGSPSGVDITGVLALDLADLTNKIAAYTDCQFAEIETVEVKREGHMVAAFLIGEADPPMIFTRAGADISTGGKQRPAFAQGTVYFRHGAKSEPGTRDDLANWRDSAIERVRRSWLGGIRKVVEAPAGHAITVVSSPQPLISSARPQSAGLAITAEINATPGAVRVVPQNAEEIWPLRQKDLLELINKELKLTPAVNGHDILCINTSLKILKDHPEFGYKPHRLSSPQYSGSYADWIVAQYRSDPRFFQRMRGDYKQLTQRR